MAFTYKSNGYNVTGAKARETGTFANTDGSTGGTIKTMLGAVDYASASPASAVSASGGDVTIVTASNASGFWSAEGV